MTLRQSGLIFAICGFPLASLAEGCDPNYGSVCVPIASDVDCAGGKGNGPEYVRGPVVVVGADIYGVDRDGDGVACEPKERRR